MVCRRNSAAASERALFVPAGALPAEAARFTALCTFRIAH